MRRDQRLFDAAFKLLRRAVSLFLELGERHRAGRSLVNLSILHNQTGQSEEAIALLRQALDLIDPEEEPRLLLCARHNLAFYLSGSGHFQEAQRVYQEAHREALAALAFFRQAVEAERASVEIVEKVGEFLRKAQHAPDLRFQEPGE